MSSCFPSIQSFCHQNFCSLILIISCTIQIVFSLNMIILIHVLYICGEYLWSFFVNRNQVLPEPNQSNTDSAEECDVDVSYSLKHTKRFLNCPASEHSPVVNDSSQSNNLKNDFESYGEFEKALYDFDTKKIRFCPPVYIQRYLTVSNILRHERWNGQIKKVIDIGCSELGFFKFLKDIDGIEKIIEIDIDKKVLQEYSYRLHPFLSDYFNERKFPLEATILCGSVTHLDHRLEGADAVVAIELIEHLYPCDLEALPFNIFGVIKPRVAIFTTPNEDFNVLFDNFTGFRHDDHKFEWSRKQFESWAENICKRFPDYEVDFVGIGPGPNGKESLGCCSQAAVFVKIHYELPGELDHCKTYCEFVEFEVIEHIEYPFNSNTRSNDDITRDDAVNFMRSAARCGDYYNGERTEIPLANVLLRVYKTCDSSEKLRKILQESNYEVTTDKEGEYIVIVPDESVSSSEDVNEQFLTESLNESEQYIAHEVDHEVVSDDWDNVTRSDTPWDLSEIEPDEHKICNFIPDEASKEIVTTNLDHNSIEVMKNEITDNNSEKGDVDYFLNVNKADNAIECVVTDTACILEKNNDLDANKEHPLHKKHSEVSTSFSLHVSDNFVSFTECLQHDIVNEAINVHDEKDNVDDSSEFEINNTSLSIAHQNDDLSCSNEENELLLGDDVELTTLLTKSDDSYQLSFNSCLNNGSFGYICLPLENKSKMLDKSREEENSLDASSVLLKESVVIIGEEKAGENSEKIKLFLENDKILESKEIACCSKVLTSLNDSENNIESTLTVNSAYDLDECIESVQAKIKSFSDCNNSIENLITEDIFNEKSSVKGCCSNDESKCDPISIKCRNNISANVGADGKIHNEKKSDVIDSKKSESDFKCNPNKTNSIKNGDDDINGMSSVACSTSHKSLVIPKNISKNQIEIQSTKSFKLNNSPDELHCGEEFEDSVDSCIINDKVKLNIKKNLTKPGEHEKSNMICSSDHDWDKCCGFNSYSCSCFSLQSGSEKKSPPSSVHCCTERENSGICSDSSTTDNFELNRKFSKTCVNDVCNKLCAYCCTTCTSFSYCASHSTSDDQSCDHFFFNDSEQSTSVSTSSGNCKIPKHPESIGPMTSATFLFCDQSNELIIKTHQYDTKKSNSVNEDSYVDIFSNQSINSDCEEQIIRESLKLLIDSSSERVSSSEKMTKSYSASHVESLQFNFEDYSKLIKDDLHKASEDKSSAGGYRCRLENESDVEKLVQNLEELMNDCLLGDGERQDSCSPDKAGDSGYPNSCSGRDMEMDLTPEQVKEIMTESESSFENSPLNSPVAGAAAVIIPPHPPLVHIGDNVENGDVANNNRDGEGNNMIGQAAFVGEPLVYEAIIDHPQEMPLMAYADLNSSNDENDGSDYGSKIKNKMKLRKIKKKYSNHIFDDSTESDDCSRIYENNRKFRKSRTLILDRLSLQSFESDLLSTDKSVTDISTSCPDSTLNLTEDETYNTSSYSALKEWDSYRMVQSYEIKDLIKYESWLADKSSQNTLDSSNPPLISMENSVFPLDSMPSCSTAFSITDHSLKIANSIPHQLYPNESNQVRNLKASEDITVPLSFLDEALDSLIREIVEELLTPEREPFADWLLEIQPDSVTENEGEQNPELDPGVPDVPVLEEINWAANDFDNDESEHEFTVQPDVKGGGDTSASDS